MKPNTGARQRPPTSRSSAVAYTMELPQFGKLDDRVKAGMFIGYTEGVKACHMLDPTT